jgi:A/G-specific adenine glycosylase
MDQIVDRVIAWYDINARPLPWREPGTTAYAILVSEVMAQQTPVERVVPSWHAWLQMWPTPSALAQANPAEVIRMWGRLGYPRRALRLREAAVHCVAKHDGDIPNTYEDLIALPGVGDYTASAVLAFAFQKRVSALDTNVRRVLARAVGGQQRVGPSLTRSERMRARALLPEADTTAARWSQAVMELGARVCTANKPACDMCPIQQQCAWLAAGQPTSDIPAPRSQGYAGTDRQVRGLLMGLLRDNAAVAKQELDIIWADPTQRERALDSLLDDGLVELMDDGRFRLPQ